MKIVNGSPENFIEDPELRERFLILRKHFSKVAKLIPNNVVVDFGNDPSRKDELAPLLDSFGEYRIPILKALEIYHDHDLMKKLSNSGKLVFDYLRTVSSGDPGRYRRGSFEALCRTIKAVSASLRELINEYCNLLLPPSPPPPPPSFKPNIEDIANAAVFYLEILNENR